MTEHKDVRPIPDSMGHGTSYTVTPNLSKTAIEDDNNIGIGVPSHAHTDGAKPSKPAKTTCLVEAMKLVDGDRQAAYGHPKDNHGLTARMFWAWWARKRREKLAKLPRFDLVEDLTDVFDAEDVCVFNVCQKLSRLANGYHRDSVVDICGYMRNLEMVHDDE